MALRGPRLIGSETEFGITTPTRPELSPIETSTWVVLEYARATGAGLVRTRWDFETETPLTDARGFDLRRYRGPAPIVDPNALGSANLVLPNGARFYVDHAHPEYSSPELTTALDAVIWDSAGDRVAFAAAQAAAAAHDTPVKLYKNNVDGKGASYGAHENYLVDRAVEFTDLAAALIPFFVTRQIYTGAGRVGLGIAGEQPGFQISQRADYIETDISLETTLNRGIINTRDEPHATREDYRRLHVIIGDATLAQWSTYLKFAMTDAVLTAVEAGEYFTDLALADSVRSVQWVSRDLSCTRPLRLLDGRELTAVQIQQEILRRLAGGIDSQLQERITLILDLLARDPLLTSQYLDWTAKYQLLQGLATRANLDWDHPKLMAADIQYSDLDPQRGLFYRLQERGALDALVTQEQISAAMHTPPSDSRAYLRGELIRRVGDHVVAANWDSLVLATSQGQWRVPLLDPWQGTQADVDALLDSTTEIPALAAALQAHLSPA